MPKESREPHPENKIGLTPQEMVMGELVGIDAEKALIKDRIFNIKIVLASGGRQIDSLGESEEIKAQLEEQEERLAFLERKRRELESELSG